MWFFVCSLFTNVGGVVISFLRKPVGLMKTGGWQPWKCSWVFKSTHFSFRVKFESVMRKIRIKPESNQIIMGLFWYKYDIQD